MHQVRPVKLAGKAAGLLCALPYLAMYAVGCCTLGRDKAFRGSSERIASRPGMLGVYARQWFYRATLGEVGRDVYFGYMSMFSKPDIRIGDRVYIGRFCSIGRADLNDQAMLSDGVQVLSGRHQHGRDGQQRDALTFARVTVGRGVWVGTNAVVMADLGDGAVVGAGAVVTRPVPAEAKVVGVPARPLRVTMRDAA